MVQTVTLLVLSDVTITGQHFAAGDVLELDERPATRLILLEPACFQELCAGEARDLAGPPVDRMMRRMVAK